VWTRLKFGKWHALGATTITLQSLLVLWKDETTLQLFAPFISYVNKQQVVQLSHLAMYGETRQLHKRHAICRMCCWGELWRSSICCLHWNTMVFGQQVHEHRKSYARPFLPTKGLWPRPCWIQDSIWGIDGYVTQVVTILVEDCYIEVGLKLYIPSKIHQVRSWYGEPQRSSRSTVLENEIEESLKGEPWLGLEEL
jgi:hypothetical protein